MEITLHELIIITCCVILGAAKEDVEQGRNTQKLSSSSTFIQVNHYPKLLTQNCHLNISFACAVDSYVIINVKVGALTKQENSIFKKLISCKPGLQTTHKLIRIRLPRYTIYRPDHTNHYTNFAETAILRVWIAAKTKKVMMFILSEFNWEMMIKLPKPYDRPPMPSYECSVWWRRHVDLPPYAPSCPIEPEWMRVLSYPLALSGERVGLVKQLPAYKDLALLKEYTKEMDDSSFTYSFWIYLSAYCPKSLLCSIMHHASWDEKRFSPLLLINRKGQLHIEVFRRNRSSEAFLSQSSLSKNVWIFLVFSCRHSKEIRVDVKYSSEIKSKLFLTISLPGEMFFKDTMGNMNFGGSDLHPSFIGYFGEIYLHRRKALSIDQIRLPSRDHPMFQLKLQEQDTKCRQFKKKVSLYWKQLEDKKRYREAWRRVCRVVPRNITEIFPLATTSSLQCSPNQNFHRQYSFAASHIRKLFSSDSRLNTEKLSTALLNDVFNVVEQRGLSQIPATISLLKQSSCYDNHDAAYTLATIFNYGLSVKVDEMLAHSYLLRSSLSLNRLSLLSLANKHFFGIDGIPLDYGQAYVYYMTVAQHTLSDLTLHRDKDTLTELVRLTEEKKVDEQEGEEGPLFQWFRQQAARGILGAQQRMASLLYWGAKGVKRNVTTASRYYKQAAETGNPNSVHDYAVILLKGHGVKQNLPKALELLQQGALQNYSRSSNTLGWYYMVHKRDYKLAAHYFEKAFHLGDRDAGHNLAHMFLTKKYPGVDRVERNMAWEFASKAAMRGNFDSGLLVSKYNMIGHVRIQRSPRLAVEWARQLAEKNPCIGRLLSNGVKAYRLKNWEASLFYYLLAASSGTEVASFNLAFLCQENHDYLTFNMEKECAYRHYNLSALRSKRKENSYAWLKMADYFYHQQNISMATSNYAQAAINGDPQGLFNLGLLVEEGKSISDEVWRLLGVPFNTSRHQPSLLIHIYTRCRDSDRTDSYLPCLLALCRVRFQVAWKLYGSCVVSSIIALVVIVLIFTMTKLMRRPRPTLPDEI